MRSFVLVLAFITLSAARGEPGIQVDPYTMLPQPMRAEELADFARILNLSEAQQTFAASLFNEYTETLGEIAPKQHDRE